MPLTLADYKDRIIIGLGSFMFAWMLFLTNMITQAPSREEILEMLISHSPYTVDKPANTVIINQLVKDVTSNAQQTHSLKDEVFSLRLELERVLTRMDITDKDRVKKNEMIP